MGGWRRSYFIWKWYGPLFIHKASSVLSRNIEIPTPHYDEKVRAQNVWALPIFFRPLRHWHRNHKVPTETRVLWMTQDIKKYRTQKSYVTLIPFATTKSPPLSLLTTKNTLLVESRDKVIPDILQLFATLGFRSGGLSLRECWLWLAIDLLQHFSDLL